MKKITIILLITILPIITQALTIKIDNKEYTEENNIINIGNTLKENINIEVITENDEIITGDGLINLNEGPNTHLLTINNETIEIKYNKIILSNDKTIKIKINQEEIELNDIINYETYQNTINIETTKNHINQSISGSGIKELTNGLNKFEIKVIAENNEEKIYIININKKEPKIIIKNKIESLKINQEYYLEIEIQDTNKEYTIKSNNDNVEINNNKIKAIKTGTVIIEITNNNIKETLEIEIIKLNPIIKLINEIIDNIKKIIYKIAINTKLIDIYNNIENNQEIIFYDENNEIIENLEENIKTGYKLSYINNQNELIEYYLSVLGDVNSDGIISSKDYVIIKNHIMEINKIEKEIIKLSADINSDNKINSLDYAEIKNKIMEAN